MCTVHHVIHRVDDFGIYTHDAFEILASTFECLECARSRLFKYRIRQHELCVQSGLRRRYFEYFINLINLTQ